MSKKLHSLNKLQIPKNIWSKLFFYIFKITYSSIVIKYTCNFSTLINKCIWNFTSNYENSTHKNKEMIRKNYWLLLLYKLKQPCDAARSAIDIWSELFIPLLHRVPSNLNFSVFLLLYVEKRWKGNGTIVKWITHSIVWKDIQGILIMKWKKSIKKKAKIIWKPFLLYQIKQND